MVPRAYSIRVRDFQLNFAPSVDDGENFHWRKKGYSRVSLKTQGSTFPWIWRCGKFPFNRMIHMPWNFSSLSSSPSFFRSKLTPTFVRLCCFQHIHRANVSCYIFYDDRKTMNDIFLVKMFVYSIFFFSRSNTKWDWMLISYEEMLVSIDLTVNSINYFPKMILRDAPKFWPAWVAPWLVPAWSPIIDSPALNCSSVNSRRFSVAGGGPQ